jgi:FlaA1/EpsC-like NDP-sugar epimerase
MAFDVAVLAGAHYLAFVVRFEGTVPAGELAAFAYSLPCVLLAQYISLICHRVPDAAWRYVGLLEVRRIFSALLVAMAVWIVVGWSSDFIAGLVPGIHSLMPPRGVLVLDLLLGLLGLIGARVCVRMWSERVKRNRRRAGALTHVPTLLIGAGSAGAEAIKQITENPQLGIEPVGFLDDDPAKRGIMIHGARVLGTVAEVEEIAVAYGAKQALITIGNPAEVILHRIVDLCKKCDIPAKVIPDIQHILEGKVNLSAIRDVAIEDLLPREPVDLDLDSIAAFVNGRRLLITGAGGSIGSELCRLVSRFGPETLVLVDNTENNLFRIHGELTGNANGVLVIPCLADICDEERMEQVFAEHRPEMVLHAAAYKHVPMIEWNPGEAIKNNIVGTKTIADLAHRYGVGEFVMISTDKAVNSTSIMGASKRVAEVYIQALSQRSQTRFVAVRFGNVLGSAGSVIPTFKEQIARGGPVTVTHPEMKRYFMTIPEACQLVLQAATMGRGGEIFILDMGEPVKIVDLARNLISLSGFNLKDIEIRFTGIRPGEKLFEELALKDEIAKKTRHPKIFIGRLQPVRWDEINREIKDLQLLGDCSDARVILRRLKEMTPEYERAQVAARKETPIGLSANGREHDTPLSLDGVNGILPLPGALPG